MNKKAKVKMLLELLSDLKNIPTNANGGMDMVKFPEIPEVKSVIILLKFLKADYQYLSKNGFVVATMLLGKYIK